ncbi:hypothetical protein HMPREF9534_04836, partial [Escherichia coli MS 69-1]
ETVQVLGFSSARVASGNRCKIAGCGVNAFSGLLNFASVTIKNPLAL